MLCLEVRVAVGLREAVGGLKAALGCLDARLLTGPQAVEALDVVTTAERWLASRSTPVITAARVSMASRLPGFSDGQGPFTKARAKLPLSSTSRLMLHNGRRCSVF